MKVKVTAASQEEFDEKRVELIKAIAGNKLDVEVRPKGESKLTDEKEPFYAAQADILAAWNEEFAETLKDIKREIAEVIEHG